MPSQTTLPLGTTTAIVGVETDERAICRHNPTPIDFASMTDFDRTGGIQHTTEETGLQDYQNYLYYVQCQDEAGNLNSTDYLINFSVGSYSNGGPPPPTPYCGDTNCDANESCSSCEADCGVCQPPGSFPQEYSLSRPLLANNPGALIIGNDWQGMTQTSDINSYGFFTIDKNSGSEVPVYAATVDVVNGPLGAKRAEIVQDPVFGSVVRAWHTDHSDGISQDVKSHFDLPEMGSAWYRVLIKYENGFTTAGPGGGANSWKVYFGARQRHMEMSNTDDYMRSFDKHGGTSQDLPGSPAPGSASVGEIQTEWSDEQWYEFISFEEVLSPSHYRFRIWIRKVTENDALLSTPQIVTWSSGSPFKFGAEVLDGTVPLTVTGRDIQLGINRNKRTYDGVANWWQWGPWEVIDAEVVPDPYGLADDMLT
jgi:hypothetical protein